MADSFPTELQDKLNQDSFSHTFGETAIRSSVDIGPAKVRRRFTAPVDIYQCSIKLIYSDYLILKNFFDNTLNGGVLPFEYTDPFLGTTQEFRFTQPPTLTPMGGLYFMVNMGWEKLP